MFTSVHYPTLLGVRQSGCGEPMKRDPTPNLDGIAPEDAARPLDVTSLRRMLSVSKAQIDEIERACTCGPSRAANATPKKRKRRK